MYHRIDVDSQTAMGRDVMEETIEWWGKQAEDVREEALGDEDRIDLKYFIKQLNKWCVGVDVFWCQGPLFDYAILQNFYAQMNVPVPWNFWQIRDSRTLGSLVPRDPMRREQDYTTHWKTVTSNQEKCNKYSTN